MQDSFAQKENLPQSEGVFCFYNEQRQALYAGVAENIKRKVDDILSADKFFAGAASIGKIEFKKSRNNDLINLFAETIRRKKPLYNVSLAEQELYPHLKLTREEFPRLLVTRKIETDEAEYFGAFLSETGVRIWLDFLNRTFRLRSCQIAVDGSFVVPCTQFYEKRCVAPCVENLCSSADYREFVELVRLFLRNKRESVEELLRKKIESAAEILEFETAAFWREILLDTKNVWDDKDFQLWLDDAVDNFETEETDESIFIRLVTMRGRKVLGKRVFVFKKSKNFTADTIFSQFLWQFYRFHAPKEIRLSKDFSDREFLSKVLSRRENRVIPITEVKPNAKKITAERAFGRTKFEFNFKQIKLPADSSEIQARLKEELNLKYLPKRIECFDVAHISATHFAAAKVVWQNGELVDNENDYWFLDEKNELRALAKAVENRFETNDKLPNLVLIDGGKPQLNATLKILENFNFKKFTVFGAVKPIRRHNAVSHFISETGEIFKMKPESEAMQMLVSLRDAAHRLANSVHRKQRDTWHFYELAAVLPSATETERNNLLQKFGSIKRLKQISEKDMTELLGGEKGREIFSELNAPDKESTVKIKPLIVPIRFDAPAGKAKDLQPLQSKSNRS